MGYYRYNPSFFYPGNDKENMVDAVSLLPAFIG